jgi:hypothetical protein
MVNGHYDISRNEYNDLEQLKTHIKQSSGTWSIPLYSRFIFNQAGTGSEVEISEKGGLTISFASVDADLYIWAENNHADGLGLAWSATYIDAAGVTYSASGTLDGTDSTTAVVVTDSTDFYRLRTLDVITTANTGYVAIGTQNKATNYGVVEQAHHESLHSRYMLPASRDAWLTDLRLANAVATQIDTYIKISYTPYGETITHDIIYPVPQNNAVHLKPMIRMKEATDIKFVLKGNLSDNTFDIGILEATQV